MRNPWVFLSAIIPLAGIPTSLRAQDTIPAPRRQALPSGLRVVVVPRAPSESVAIELRVRHGSADSPAGLAHFLEHCLFHGGRDRVHGEIDRLMETIGAEIDARTFRDSVRFRVDVPADRWRDALAVLAELTLAPTLPGDRLEIERRIVAEERRFVGSDPIRTGTQQLFATWFAGDPYAIDPLGAPADTAAISNEALRQLHRTVYRPERMSLVLGGPVDPAEALRVADALFAGQASTAKYRPAGPPPPASIPVPASPSEAPQENAHNSWIHVGFRIDTADAAAVARAEAVARWLVDPDHGLWMSLAGPQQPLLVQGEVFPLRRGVLGVARCAIAPKYAEAAVTALDARVRALAAETDTVLETQWKAVQARLLAKWDSDGGSVSGAVTRAAQHEGRDAAGDDDRIRAAIATLTVRELRETLSTLARPGGIRVVGTGAPIPVDTAKPVEESR